MALLHQIPSAGESGKPPYSLASEARIEEMYAAGFELINHRLMEWSVVYGSDDISAICDTFFTVNVINSTTQNVKNYWIGCLRSQ